MSTAEAPKVGTIAWHDLTVPNADVVRDFYQAVVGWRPEPVDMGDYSDYNMIAASTGESAAGVCYARGVNAKVPPVWMIYIIVDDLDRCIAQCQALGGKVLDDRRGDGSSRLGIIQDPAGAVCALYQP